MKINDDIKKYGTLIVGLLIAGGFAFGGMASYSSMISSSQSSNNQNNEFNATLPSQTFSTEDFGLSLREQRVLAARNDVAIVTLLYDNEESFEQLQELDGVQNDFNGRMYIQLVNESSTSAFSQYGFTEFPKGVVVGGSRGNSALQIVQDPSASAVVAASCSALATWNPRNGESVADVCSQ